MSTNLVIPTVLENYKLYKNKRGGNNIYGINQQTAELLDRLWDRFNIIQKFTWESFRQMHTKYKKIYSRKADSNLILCLDDSEQRTLDYLYYNYPDIPVYTVAETEILKRKKLNDRDIKAINNVKRIFKQSKIMA